MPGAHQWVPNKPHPQTSLMNLTHKPHLGCAPTLQTPPKSYPPPHPPTPPPLLKRPTRVVLPLKGDKVLVAAIGLEQALAVVQVHKRVALAVCCSSEGQGGRRRGDKPIAAAALRCRGGSTLCGALCGAGAMAGQQRRPRPQHPPNRAQHPASSAQPPPNSAGMKLLATVSRGATLSTLKPARFFTLRLSIASATCTAQRSGAQRLQQGTPARQRHSLSHHTSAGLQAKRCPTCNQMPLAGLT